MATSDPVPKRERVELLDALRGFALFGILLANILYWSGWIFMRPEQQVAIASAEAASRQYALHHIFVDGKFYTLFSLLFGIGFAVQLERLNSRGADAVRIFRRRLLVLLGIGLIHMVLIWDGDILTFYALIGMLLPFFRNWSDRALLAASAILIFVVPLAGYTAFEAMDWRPHQPIAAFGDRIFASFGGNPADPLGWLKREEPSAFAGWVLGGWPYAISTRIENWRIPKLLGIMLLGLFLGRRLAAGRLLDDRRLLWWTFALGLLIGLPFSIAYGVTPGFGQTSIASLYGTVPLALAYAAGFALAWPRAKRWLRFLVAPGRMALTNYLLQTVSGILIFYGVGLGWAGTLPPAGIYGVALLIFSVQIAFSHWWLNRHEQGPMERLWRLGTYGRSRRLQST